MLYLIPWISLLASWLFSVIVGSNLEVWGGRLFIASALLLGIPHGAEDFRIICQLSQKTKFRFSTLLAVYLLLVLSVVVLWLISPSMGLVAFFLLSIWHFGSGDAIWEQQNRLFIMNSLGRGLIVLSASLFLHPLESQLVLSKLSAKGSSLIISASSLLFFLGLFLSLLSVLLRGKLSFFDLESILIIIFFWLVPSPLFAVAIYFICVHSWRHFLRICFHEKQDLPDVFSLWQNLWRFHLRVLPVTLISIVLMLLIWHQQQFISTSVVEIFLIFLSALTLPHALVVLFLEKLGRFIYSEHQVMQSVQAKSLI
ncbi:MAG: hypothetical protein KatS3mg006_1745 [Pyrinomonadaceae bacterium]|nr:MAG: hypothetical protein KatS3mg006_1745 [Pyrinomonadaceae bacterium]